jgi:hypothetical protein
MVRLRRFSLMLVVPVLLAGAPGCTREEEPGAQPSAAAAGGPEHAGPEPAGGGAQHESEGGEAR